MWELDLARALRGLPEETQKQITVVDAKALVAKDSVSSSLKWGQEWSTTHRAVVNGSLLHLFHKPF